MQWIFFEVTVKQNPLYIHVSTCEKQFLQTEANEQGKWEDPTLFGNNNLCVNPVYAPKDGITLHKPVLTIIILIIEGLCYESKAAT